MFNYNISPVNIHYRKYPDNKGVGGAAQNQEKTQINPDQNQNQRKFPNGKDVAIDYTKNRINISQIFEDFRSTISAINTPDSIKEEVESYLLFSEKETTKETPSREIVLTNLKNAARITDKYIEDSLKKPSRVVEDWVDALFLQNIVLKPDINDTNEAFRVKIPEKKPKEIIQTPHSNGLVPLEKDTVTFTSNKENEVGVVENKIETTENFEPEIAEIAEVEIQPKIEESKETKKPYEPKTEKEALAKECLFKGIEAFKNGENLYNVLKLYDDALSLVQDDNNSDIKSAIYFERAKVFDSFDYAELALIDYHKATKASDYNLKTHAHIKMGNIYDDYVQIDPAIDQYSKAIETSEEVDNLQGKTKALRCLASLFSGIYDTENTQTFTELALESAKETKNPKTIATTYFEAAHNYKYIGEDKMALRVYKELAQDESVQEDYQTLAKNYMEAAILMEQKGNKKKAYSLMLKSKEYQRLQRLNQEG